MKNNAQNMLDEIFKLKQPKLFKYNKELLQQYSKHINNFDKTDFSVKEQEQYKELLDDELFYITLFLLWLQDNKMRVIKK